MAYADSNIFYGWFGKEALDILNILLKKVPKLDNRNNIEKNVNVIDSNLKKIDPHLGFKHFRGGLCSKESTYYIHFGIDKHNQSCNGDDISDINFTIEELKKFFDMSFQFKKKYPVIKTKPKLIHLTVADDK